MWGTGSMSGYGVVFYKTAVAGYDGIDKMSKIGSVIYFVVLPLSFLYAAMLIIPAINGADDSDSVLNRKFSSMSSNSSGRDAHYIDEKYLHDNNGVVRPVTPQMQTASVYYHNLNIREEINRNTDFYQVEAEDPSELREKIVMFAPENASTGKKTVTKVTYGIDWSLDTRQEDGECKFYGANVVTTVNTMVPQWVGIESQSDDVKSQWGNLLNSVSKYEAKHNQIMVEITREISNRIRFIPRQALCSELINKVNDIGNHGIELAKEKMKRYRYETGGGKLMGVKMPAFARQDYIETVNAD